MHGLEVKYLRAFLEGNPKTFELVFIYISTTIATKSNANSTQSKIHEIISIVTNQSTTMGTNPNEAIGVLEYVVSEVIRHSCRHIEIAYVIATRSTALCINAQGYQNGAYYGENESNHLLPFLLSSNLEKRLCQFLIEQEQYTYLKVLYP